MSESRVASGAQTRIDAGAVQEFEPGKFRMVTAGTREIGVIQLRSGAFRAVHNRCPHKGAAICKGIVGGTWPPSPVGQLEFVKDGEILVCPWHGFEYDLDTGAEMFWSKGIGLRLYPTEVVEGRVQVILSGRGATPST